MTWGPVTSMSSNGSCQSPYFFTLTWVNKCSQYFYFYQSIVTHEHLYFYLSKGCVYVCHLCMFLTSNLCFQPTYKSIIHNNPVKSVQKSAQIEQCLQAITVQNSAKQICGWFWCERQQEMHCYGLWTHILVKKSWWWIFFSHKHAVLCFTRP